MRKIIHRHHNEGISPQQSDQLKTYEIIRRIADKEEISVLRATFTICLLLRLLFKQSILAKICVDILTYPALSCFQHFKLKTL